MAYNGTIKSFNPEKGWGFIECPETAQLYGKDIFVLRNALPGGMASQGLQVSFDVVQEHNGPVAAQVQIRGAGPGGHAPARAGFGGRLAGAGPGRGAFPLMAGCGGPMIKAGAGMGAKNGTTFTGCVKSFNAEKGWGMIACQATEQMYGKDVFLAKSAVGGGSVSPGDQVRFSIKMETKGPAAATVQVIRGQHPGMMVPMSMQMPMHMPMQMQMQMPFHRPRQPPSDQTFFGSIKSFNEEKGWGHIACEATKQIFDKDVFLMRGALGGQPAQPGALVSFKVSMGAKGPQAIELSFLPPGSFRNNGEAGMVFTGHVKSFNAGKGWGFVSDDSLREIFGKDIFLHKREVEGGQITPGDEIHFSVDLDEAGQPVAKVQPVEGSYQPARGDRDTTPHAAPY